ncbi:MAG: outer membrane protein assembly factor BamD [Hyphomicrobiaceae bacterium]
MALMTWMARHKAALAAVALLMSAAGLSGCASSDAAKALNPDPPGKMYADADALMSAGRFDEAARKFEELDRDHPYAPEARRAMVMAAFAYYKAKKNPEAIASARRYTTMHPGTKDAALAHHVIASAYFDDIKDPAHDQTAARRALTELKVITTRFPDSPYAKQADNRVRIAEDSIAANEMYIGRNYLKQGRHLAAINRFKVVVSEHQTTQHVEEALHRMAEGYIALGIREEAQACAAVLGHNFPQSRWYQDSYALLGREGLRPQANQGSWIAQQWRKIAPSGPAPKLPPKEPTVAPQPEPTAPGAKPPADQQDVPTASTVRPARPMGLSR